MTLAQDTAIVYEHPPGTWNWIVRAANLEEIASSKGHDSLDAARRDLVERHPNVPIIEYAGGRG